MLLYFKFNITLLLAEKTEMFMELYGNTLLRDKTSAYLKKSSYCLEQMVTDLDYADERMPCLDFTPLKVLLIYIYISILFVTNA